MERDIHATPKYIGNVHSASSAAIASDAPHSNAIATVARISMAGMQKAISTALNPTPCAAMTLTSWPMLYREVSAQRTSIIFSLLSEDAQCIATLQELHALCWMIRTCTIPSPASIASMMPLCEIRLLVLVKSVNVLYRFFCNVEITIRLIRCKFTIKF